MGYFVQSYFSHSFIVFRLCYWNDDNDDDGSDVISHVLHVIIRKCLFLPASGHSGGRHRWRAVLAVACRRRLRGPRRR